MKRVYMDNNSTTAIAPEVFDAMTPFLTSTYGNASSVHTFGREANKAMEAARESIASAVGAQPKEIIFTSGGTESDNLALRGVAAARAAKGKGKHIITSSVEHHAVYNVAKELEKEGFEVTYLPVNPWGRVDPEQVRSAIRDDTILISVMTANNEVGTIQPIAAIGKIAKEKKITFHTDAVQAFGKIPINVNDMNVDLMSLSSHKVHGPKGVGALFLRKGVSMKRLIAGGHHERNRRAGTENVPAIVGFGKAVELFAGDIEAESAKVSQMRDRLQSLILQKVDHVYLAGDPENRLPNTFMVGFNFVEGEGILLNLDIKGVAVSTGSACSSGSLEPSHVLLSMDIPVELAQGGVRFSLSRYNTPEQVDYVADMVAEVIPRLRDMSPLYDKYIRGELDMDAYYRMSCYSYRA
jgi:cysteine desulfurase